MRISLVIGTDHRGFRLKQELITRFRHDTFDIAWVDVGASSDERSDYPVFARKAVQEMQAGRAQLGILLCGTGIGMAIAANRLAGIYAGVAWNPEVARKGREDDHMNVLCVPADYCSYTETAQIITAWLDAVPKSGRYAERVQSIDE